LFRGAALQSGTAVRAIYLVSEILAKKLIKPFSEGGIIKECLSAVPDIAFPDDIMSNIGLSRFAIGRRIGLPNNIEERLREKAANFQWLLLAMRKHRYK
jgi:hypothetical protein